MSDRRLGSGELFPTDTPVPADAMIGRAEDVDAVATSLTGGTSVVLAGPRRIGKTTVGDAAISVCRADGCYTASLDLFTLADAAAFAEALVTAVLLNRPRLKQLRPRAERAAGRLVGLLAPTVTARLKAELGDVVEIAWTPELAQRDGAAALHEAFAVPQRVAEADGPRVVLFLDEFQEIAAPRGLYGDHEVVTRQLRSALQRSPDVSVLFAGSVEHLMRDLFSPDDRALSQFGNFHELGPIDSEEWRAGLRERLSLDGCTIADGPLDRLIALGEGHPRITMLIAQRAHAVAVAELVREVDAAMVEAAVELAMGADRLKHEQTLQRIRGAGRHAQRLAQRVAIGTTLYEGLAPQVASRTLHALEDAGVAERARSGWVIGDPLVRRYLAALPLYGPVTVEKTGGASTRGRAGGNATVRKGQA